MYISLNGKLLDSNAVGVSPESEAFSYGYGLFETIKVMEGKMCFFKEHMERMKKGCSSLDLEFKYDEEILEKYCFDLIKRNKLICGGIKVTYSKNKKDCFLLISTRDNIYTEESYKKGFKICFSDIKRNPYSAIVYLKSNNYLENLLARKRAKEKGFDEAVFLNVHDKVCEGTISNIFFINDNKIFTPDSKCGILSGILREKVMEIIKNQDLELHIGAYEKEQLYTADEIFITNSLIDIMPVSKLEDKEFDIKNNNVTRVLMKEIEKLYGWKI